MYGALITEPDFNVKLVQFVFKVRSYFRWGVIELCSWEKYNEQTLLLSYKIYLQLQILPFRLFCQQNSDQLTRPLITAICTCRYGSCWSELVMYQAVWEQTGGLHSWARYFGITTQVSFHQSQSTDNLILQGRAGTPPPPRPEMDRHHIQWAREKYSQDQCQSVSNADSVVLYMYMITVKSHLPPWGQRKVAVVERWPLWQGRGAVSGVSTVYYFFSS